MRTLIFLISGLDLMLNLTHAFANLIIAKNHMYLLRSRNPLTIIVTALLFLGALLYGKQWANSLPDVVDESFATAVVVSVERTQMRSVDKTGGEIVSNIGVAKLQLDDGKKFTSTFPQPFPSPGDRISVKVIRYSDGTISAATMPPGT